MTVDHEQTFLLPGEAEAFGCADPTEWRFAVPWDPEGTGPAELVILEHGDTTSVELRKDRGGG